MHMHKNCVKDDVFLPNVKKCICCGGGVLAWNARGV